MSLQAEEEETIEALKKWWDENGKQLVAIAVFVFGGYGGWLLWQNSQVSASEQASDLYEQILELASGELTTQEERADIINISNELMVSHSDSVYAYYGALFAAQQHVGESNLDAAEEVLNWVLQNPQASLFDSEDEGLLLTVTLRLARVVLSKGEAERALGLVNSVIPGPFEAGYSELRGDIYVAMDRYLDARDSYVAAQQAGSVSEMLQMKLSELPNDN